MSEQERVNAGVQPATGAGEPTPIIFLDDIRVTFKTRTGSILHPNKVQAVRGLTLKLMPGETLGIVGESGCGKSTTANVMCGLQQPTSGKVFFKGEDVTKRSAAQRRLIGRVISVVFQDPATALNARMSVHDQLMDPLVVHKVGDKTSRERRVLDLIEMVGLPNSVLDALPGQLSGGQRQRVAIARALSLEPDAIIADEPTSALDVSVRAQILNLLMDLKREPRHPDGALHFRPDHRDERRRGRGARRGEGRVRAPERRLHQAASGSGSVASASRIGQVSLRRFPCALG